MTIWITSASSGWALRNSSEARPSCTIEEASVLQVTVQPKSPHVKDWVVAAGFLASQVGSPRTDRFFPFQLLEWYFPFFYEGQQAPDLFDINPRSLVKDKIISINPQPPGLQR
jgi:hypothetical protein